MIMLRTYGIMVNFRFVTFIGPALLDATKLRMQGKEDFVSICTRCLCCSDLSYKALTNPYRPKPGH